MPSTAVRPQPSLQHLNNSQPGNHHAHFVSKPFPQPHGVHWRDTPVNNTSGFHSVEQRPHAGNPTSSLGFSVNSAIPPVPDAIQLPSQMAGMVRNGAEGTHRQPEVDNASDSSSIGSYETRNAIPRDLPPLQAQSALEEYDQMRPLSGDLLDALKALKAIKYSNAVAEALSPIQGHDFTTLPVRPTLNSVLEDKAAKAFDALVEDDLPAYITHMYVQIVSLSISQRITGTLAPHLREASEGLAECFVITDVNRPDNPIVFASEGT
ncbi:MAG: hypothetical protein Q9218_000904 [Villophora microphyllina]